MKYLVFQHLKEEHPGSLRKLFDRDGITWDVVRLDLNEEIPQLDHYDALIVMGGPMDVWEEEKHPWLIKEKIAIKTWVSDLKKPYLGICLGHQLLADALGGECGAQDPAQVGFLGLTLTQEGETDTLYQGMPKSHKNLQWHLVQVTQAPQNAMILASSPDCKIEAMRVGDNAWGTQYHLEVESDTVDGWIEDSANLEALKNSVGEAGYQEMQNISQNNIDEYLNRAEILYTNFRDFVRKQSSVISLHRPCAVPE